MIQKAIFHLKLGACHCVMGDIIFTQNITWELVRNTGSQSPPDPLESALISRWFKYTLKNQLAFYFFLKKSWGTGIVALFFKKGYS